MCECLCVCVCASLSEGKKVEKQVFFMQYFIPQFLRVWEILST